MQCVTKTTTLIPGEQTAVKLTQNYPRGEGRSRMIMRIGVMVMVWEGDGQHWLNAKGTEPDVFASLVNGIC